jgi:hypothetical protein
MAQIMPLFAILFFILCLANCGAPLSLNFIGEFLSLYGVFERSSLFGIFASSSIVFSAAYTMYMYQKISFGGSYSNMLKINTPDLNKREYMVLLTLVVPTIMFGIYPAPILDGMNYAVSTLIYSFDLNVISCDAPRAWGLYFQDCASPQMEALVELHDNIIYYLVAILFAVGWIQGAIIRNLDIPRILRYFSAILYLNGALFIIKLNIFILIFFILLTIIIVNILYLIQNNKHNILKLEGLWYMFSKYIEVYIIATYDLTPPELGIYSCGLNKIHLVFLLIGLCFIFINVITNKKENNSIFSFPYLMEKLNTLKTTIINRPNIILNFAFFFIAITIVTQFMCNLIGLTIITDNWSIYIVSLYTRLVFVKSMYAIVFLPHTKNIKEWYSVVSINPFLPLAIIPYSYLSLYFILPQLMVLNLWICGKMDITLANFKLGLDEFKLAFVNILDGILSYLSHELLCLKNLFIKSIKIFGQGLINLKNRPAQVGKFLVYLADGSLGGKVESITRKPLHSSKYERVSWIYPEEVWEKAKIRSWTSIKSKPEFSPIIIAVPISTGTSSNLSILVGSSLKDFFSTICKYSGDIFNAMEGFKNAPLIWYLPQENIYAELQGIRGKLFISFKDANGKQLDLNNYDELFYNFYKDYNNKAKDFLRKSNGYITKLLDITNPDRSENNLVVNMQNEFIYDKPNTSEGGYNEEELTSFHRTEFIHNHTQNLPNLGQNNLNYMPATVYNGEGHINTDGANYLQMFNNVQMFNNEHTSTYPMNDLVSLPYNTSNTLSSIPHNHTQNLPNLGQNNLNYMTGTPEEDYNHYYNQPLNDEEITSLIYYLKNSKSELNPRDRRFSLRRLGIFVNKDSNLLMVATKDKKEVHPLLSRLFRNNKYLFYNNSNGNVELSHTSKNKLIDELEKLKSSNDSSIDSNYSTPLNDKEITDLIEDLKNRKNEIKYDAGKKLKHALSHIGISVNRYNHHLMAVTEEDEKEVHPLLSRLYKNNKDLFKKDRKGNLNLSNTSTNILIADLEKLKSSNSVKILSQ